VEETPTIKYVDVGSGRQELQETLGRLLPLAEGQEVRIVQSTGNLRYLVLPATPGCVSPGMPRGDGLLNFSTEKTSPMAISETTVLDSQVVTAENVAVEQLVQQSMEAEELIVESTVVSETVTEFAQESQLMAAEVEAVAVETVSIV
jgi:hypothetical protein